MDVGRPIEIDPEATRRSGGRDEHDGDGGRDDVLVLRDGPGVIAATWVSPSEVASVRFAIWLRRRVRGVGDEAFRVRVSGGLVARRGELAVNVSVALQDQPKAERGRVAEIVARACLDG